MKALQQEKCWCPWRYVTVKGDTKKIPFNVYTGKWARPNDPATWCTYPEAVEAYKSGNYSGVGLFFSGDLCGVDIDGGSHKTPPSDEHNPLEAEILELFAPSYAERSPSKTGCHILFRCDPDRLPTVLVDGKKKLDAAYWQHNASIDIEFYAAEVTNKFFTWTGDIIDGRTEIVNRTEAAAKFVDRYMRKPDTLKAPARDKPSTGTGTARRRNPSTGAANQSSATPTVSTPEVDGHGGVNIAERLNIARNAKNGAKFRRLYDLGDTSDYDNDDSRADEALCRMLLCWLDRDPALVDAAFRGSALYREKWERRDYREGTIAKALAAAEAKGDMVFTPSGPRYCKSDDLTEAGAAEVFARLYRDEILWCDSIGWLVWNGQYWEANGHLAMAKAKQFTNDMLLEALDYVQAMTLTDAQGNSSTPASAIERLRYAKRMRSAKGIKSMLELSKDSFNIDVKRLDADPYLLCTPGGCVDLHTGEVKPADPGMLCTMVTEAVPSDEGADEWHNFLTLVTSGDVEVEGYLKRVCGMSLIGKVLDEKLVIAFNTSGRNGKSTMFNAIQRAVGSYGGSIDVDALTADRNNKKATLATLRGKRLIICGELGPGKWLDTSVLKRMTSTDPIVGEQKFKDPMEFDPSHHLIMYTNNLPRVPVQDNATWRRLELVPFAATMPSGQDEIKNYGSILAERAGGAILRWCIEGAVEYIGNGCHLHAPDAVKEATRQYRGADDWCGHFTDECTVKAPGVKLKHRELFEKYQEWSASGGDDCCHNSRELKDALRQHGWRDVSPGNVLHWKDRDLNPDIYGIRAN